MNPTEFRAVLGELGLTQAGLARDLSEPDRPPVNPVSIWRWASGARAVPSGVAAYLRLRLAHHRRAKGRRAAG